MRSIKPLTRLVLVNAIYFLGDRLDPFDAAKTRNEAFRPTAAATEQVPMMQQESHFGEWRRALSGQSVSVHLPRFEVNPSEALVEFKADHPFLFFIVEKDSGVILFMGRVSEP